MRECPACGFKAEAISDVEIADGELIEVIGRKKRDRQLSDGEKSAFYAQLKGYAQTHDYANGWAAHKFRDKFNLWPNGYEQVPAMDPTPKVLSWIKSRQIAWAKSKQHHVEQPTA